VAGVGNDREKPVKNCIDYQDGDISLKPNSLKKFAKVSKIRSLGLPQTMRNHVLIGRRDGFDPSLL